MTEATGAGINFSTTSGEWRCRARQVGSHVLRFMSRAAVSAESLTLLLIPAYTLG